MRGKCAVGDGFVDHAPVSSLAGCDPVGEKHGAHGARTADLPRQSPGTAGIRDETDACECLNEAGTLCGNHDITGEREIGPCPCGNPVDGRDGGNRAVVNGAKKRFVFVAQGRLEIERNALDPVRKILTRAEGPPLAGENERTDTFGGNRDDREKFGAHLAVQRVHHFGPIQGDDAKAVDLVIGDRLHPRPPPDTLRLYRPSAAGLSQVRCVSPSGSRQGGGFQPPTVRPVRRRPPVPCGAGRASRCPPRSRA